MELIIHRVNSINNLKKISNNFGVEIDIRTQSSNLILSHNPYKSGDKLVDFLDEYDNGTLILNIKETGIENEVLNLVKERSNIKNFFLLDVEFPYIQSAIKKGEKRIAVRFSETESIETVKKYQGSLDWVWIDTYSILPINAENSLVLNNFKKCLVCPERWGRTEDIKFYKEQMENLNFHIDAVMTSFECYKLWEDD